METKPGLIPLRLIPAKGGVIVENEYGPPQQHEGMLIEIEPPHVFTDHDALCRFLFTYFVDTEAELKKRAEQA